MDEKELTGEFSLDDILKEFSDHPVEEEEAELPEEGWWWN